LLVKTEASEESIAQEATAAPSLPNAIEAPKSVTWDSPSVRPLIYLKEELPEALQQIDCK